VPIADRRHWKNKLSPLTRRRSATQLSRKNLPLNDFGSTSRVNGSRVLTRDLRDQPGLVDPSDPWPTVSSDMDTRNVNECKSVNFTDFCTKACEGRQDCENLLNETIQYAISSIGNNRQRGRGVWPEAAFDVGAWPGVGGGTFDLDSVIIIIIIIKTYM